MPARKLDGKPVTHTECASPTSRPDLTHAEDDADLGHSGSPRRARLIAAEWPRVRPADADALLVIARAGRKGGGHAHPDSVASDRRGPSSAWPALCRRRSRGTFSASIDLSNLSSARVANRYCTQNGMHGGHAPYQ